MITTTLREVTNGHGEIIPVGATVSLTAKTSCIEVRYNKILVNCMYRYAVNTFREYPDRPAVPTINELLA